VTGSADPAAELALGDYQPKSMLRRPAHVVERPAFPAIDAHNHLGHETFAGDWPRRSAADLAATLDAAGVERLVDLDGFGGDHLRREIERWQLGLPGRVAVFAGLDYDAWQTDERFGETEAGRLRDGVAAGARGLKVWKLLGLRARDPQGRLVAIDDPRLDPLWAGAAELAVPVTIHIADPIAFFEPLDSTNERWEELHEHPDWHFWPRRPTSDGGGFPSFDELIDGLENLLERHSGTTFIGAHVGCAAEDLDRVSSMLERHPNFHCDIAARIAELGRQPYTARQFFIRWQDRVLFGTDMAPDPAWYRVYYRFLETLDESFDYDVEGPPSQGRWQIHGLGLPADVLDKIYRSNALRLIRWS
jgi:predicted TIM-barrel fold metal-dependent hydrolase